MISLELAEFVFVQNIFHGLSFLVQEWILYYESEIVLMTGIVVITYIACNKSFVTLSLNRYSAIIFS